ncbi:hypothetical protein I6A84_31395 [Frankia sp. CNm7]|uniref:Uncharacterized protein n=1 Tax=Frankia nepalensis TaxID=1836974 RepID=A0A937UP01_9ACTN|nr:hypothetical protein [Frankia nepalensis]MBL7497079.1 hypothetical protein [Frankia nepalensis]MBL7510750.1 hypothetical protein [Frankia nepalensis]MBL7522468.1 hypothetical protein [Frankia nepalensis]MBL7626760.1 hypothetical protein [Frankia nepalensis]
MRRPRRVGGAAALVVLIALGVGVPAGLLAGCGWTDAHEMPARPPASPFGGFSVTWLPGLTHRLDIDSSGQLLGPPIIRNQSVPGVQTGILSREVWNFGPTTFRSLFIADEAAGGAEANPSAAWVTVGWRPEAVTNISAMIRDVDSYVNAGCGQIEVIRDSVGGRPAIVLRHDATTSASSLRLPGPVPAGLRYQTTLAWIDGTGVVLAVDLSGPSYPDVAVAHRIADGIVLAGTPPRPT